MASRSGDTIRLSRAEFGQLQADADAGRAYVAELQDEITRLARLTGTEVFAREALAVVRDPQRLVAVRNEFRRRWDEVLPPQTRCVAGGQETPPSAAELRTWQGLGVDPGEAAKHRG